MEANERASPRKARPRARRDAAPLAVSQSAALPDDAPSDATRETASGVAGPAPSSAEPRNPGAAPGPRWTDEQWQGITTVDRSLLVSAAAGSGKTAMLSERCAHLVC